MASRNAKLALGELLTESENAEFARAIITGLIEQHRKSSDPSSTEKLERVFTVKRALADALVEG